jgi:flagellar hook-associated protein 1 FlgK
VASAIAQLNENIATSSSAGMSPTDLLDQRDLLVSRLSDLVGITVKPTANGGVDIFVGGTALVRGSQAEQLRVDAEGGTITMRWVRTGTPPASPVAP